MRLARNLVLLGVALGTTACGSITGSLGWERVVGIIDIGSDAPLPTLELPETIRSGVPFTATVVTWGSGTCTRPAGAEVRHYEGGVEITPFDRWPVGEAVCTDDLRPYPRSVEIRIDGAGEAVVRVVGRTLWPSEPTEHEVRVTVQP